MQLYEVAFYGDLAPNTDLQTVQNNLATLFKADKARIALMFSGKKITIKNKVDAATAEKYRLAMLKAGAIASIENISNQQQDNSVPEVKNESKMMRNAESNNLRNAPLGLAHPHQVGPDSSSFAPLQVSPKDVYTKAFEHVQAVNFGVVPVDSGLGQKQQSYQVAEFDLSGFSLSPVGVDLEQVRENKEASIPDISHLSVV